MPRLKQNITPLYDIVLLPGEVADPTNETQVADRKVDKQLDELYADASIADRMLGRFINQVSHDFPGCVAGIKSAPLKDRGTAKDKLTRGPARKAVEDLKDIARATITFNSEEAMYAARDYITRQRCFTDLDGSALKDRYLSVREGGMGATAQGYRDIKFFLSMDIGRGDYHIVELQLNTKSALKAKDVGHPFYDVTRIGGETWHPDQPNSDITIPRDKVEKLAWKLLKACHECISRNIEPAAARRVEQMVKREFFQPVYARNAATGNLAVGSNQEPVIRRYEPRTRTVTLRFNNHARRAEGLALLQVSPAAYLHYKRLARQFSWRSAENMHAAW